MIVEQFDTFLFDLDGVVYVGEEPLPGAVASIRRLNELDKQLRFLTNDPRPTRQTIAERLQNLGIEAAEEQIVSAGWATAHYLAQRNVQSAAVVGSEGLRTALRTEGIDVTDDEPEAVVVGATNETSYQDIQRATRHIDRGATFVGTNPDGSFPTPDGPAPGAGAIVKAVEAASGTDPTVIGKPEPFMFEMALDRSTADEDAVVVGDNPATDILGAHRAGLTGILVADEDPTVASPRDFQQPEKTISTLGDLFATDTSEWITPSFSWPDEITPGVAAVVINESDEVLLIKRADTEQWALPTGSVERCEPVVEAIKREVNEETGLDIEIEELTGVYSHPDQQVFSYPSGKSVHFVTTCFRCTVVGGTPEADEDEALAVAFVDEDELPATTLPMQSQWISDALGSNDDPAIR